MLQLLQDGQGHQCLEQTLALCWEQFYWNTISQDITEYMKNCPGCHAMKGTYTDPKTKLNSVIANSPLDLLPINFMKVDPPKDDKGNILVLTNAFTRLNQAFISLDQEVLTIAKILVNK